MNSNRQHEILLGKIADAFQPFIRPPRDLARVRQSIRSYLSSRIEEARKDPLASTTAREEQLPPGLRAEYLEAVKINLAAQHRYDVLASHTRDHLTPPDSQTATQPSKALIDQHVDLSRLQKQNASLVELKDELESLRLPQRTAALDNSCSSAEALPPGAPKVASQIDLLSDSITRSIKALELAVVEAQLESEHQKTLFEDAKTQNADFGNATPQQRAQAMSKTQQELTAWLEENLDRCPAEESLLENSDDKNEEAQPSISDEQIDAQYERYLESRRRLLSAVRALTEPIAAVTPETVTASTGAVSTHLDEPTHNRFMNKVEQSLLPALQQQHASQTHLIFTEEQLQKETSRMISVLDRLSDESQLLQAFPILAHSGRFEHATATFGKKFGPLDDGEKDEVAARIEPWMFAAKAADVSSTGIMEKHLDRGKEAMEAAAKSLAELRILREAQLDDT